MVSYVVVRTTSNQIVWQLALVLTVLHGVGQKLYPKYQVLVPVEGTYGPTWYQVQFIQQVCNSADATRHKYLRQEQSDGKKLPIGRSAGVPWATLIRMQK